METTLHEQINAIRASMIGLSPKNKSRIALNDAASTIASLNMTKDLPDPQKRIAELEEALTKREYFAGLALQAFISRGEGISISPTLLGKEVELAIIAADELLKQLEK